MMKKTIIALVLVICVYQAQGRPWNELMPKASFSEQEMDSEGELSKDENLKALFRRPCKRQAGRPGCRGYVKEPFRTAVKRAYESPILRDEMKSDEILVPKTV